MKTPEQRKKNPGDNIKTEVAEYERNKNIM
jgi:hypothetical protein